MKYSMIVILAFAVIFFSIITANSKEMLAENKRPVMKAKYVKNLKMDGKLSDPAWKKAPEYSLELARDPYTKQQPKIRAAVGETQREKGSVKLLWNENYLYIGVTMEDSDVVAEGEKDQTHLFLMGDTVEVFLKPADDTYYWELYGTANNKKTSYFYPSRARRLPSSFKYKPAKNITVIASVDGTRNDWQDRDNGWSVEIAIPAELLTQFGAKFNESSKWTILVARYNYSRYLQVVENSSAPRLSDLGNHVFEEYAELVLEK